MSGYDGYITIGTKVDSNSLESELRNLKKELSKYEKENQMLLKQKAKIELDNAEANKKIQETSEKLEQLDIQISSATLKKENAPKFSEAYFEAVEQINQLQAETKEYDKQHFEALNLIKKQETALSDINTKIQDNVKQQSLLKNEIIGVNNKLRQQNALDTISNKITGIVKKVTGWGLALFGIRGAYSMISRAMSTLSQQDKNMASQLKYIQWALANAIAPIVKFIINGVYLIMSYINKIWRLLFGHDLFKGTNAFAKSMKSASNSAKEIRKELAGFDEMNILGGNTTASADTGIGAPSFENPKFDTSGLEYFAKKVKEKMKEAKKSIEDMKKSLNDPQAYNEAYGEYGDMVRGMTSLNVGLSSTIQGIIDTITGLWDVFMGTLTGDKERVEKGAKKLKKGLSEIFEGLFYGLYGVFLLVWGWVKAKTIQTADFIYKHVVKPLLVAMGKDADELDAKWEEVCDSFIEKTSISADEMKKIFGEEKGKKLVEEYGIGINEELDNAWKKAENNSTLAESGIKKPFSREKGKNVADQYGGGFNEGLDTNLSKADKNFRYFTGSVLDAFSQEKGKKTGKGFGSGLKEGLISGLNLIIAKLNLWIANLNNLKIGGVGLNIKPIKPIALAKGTILNNPGRGVPIGNAIAGERGREAVLPLSDSQLLEELGSTIGRYITINLTNETKLDGRTIARKVSQLSNNDNFLRNR